MIPPPATRSVRKAWLALAIIALLSALMPWSCKTSAVTYAFQWSVSDGAQRLLGTSLWLPMAVLLTALMLEVRPRPYGRRPLVPLALGALAALSILASTERCS